MPDFGGRFRGDAGITQIDQNFRNFEILSSGSGVGTSATLVSRVDISFTACPEPPMLFLKTNNNVAGQVAFQNWIKTGANYTGARIIVTGLLSFSWFIAVPAFTLSSDTWGMRVRDSAGKIVFESGKQYLKIIDAVRIGVSNGFDGVKFPVGYPGYVSHAATSDPYYCLGAGNGHIITDSLQVNTFGTIRNRDSSSVSFSFTETIINTGAYAIYASTSYNNLANDWIYQVPIIVGILSG